MQLCSQKKIPTINPFTTRNELQRWANSTCSHMCTVPGQDPTKKGRKQNTQCVHHKTIEMHICMRTKQSKWCTHCEQEIPKQVYTLSCCKPVYETALLIDLINLFAADFFDCLDPFHAYMFHVDWLEWGGKEGCFQQVEKSTSGWINLNRFWELGHLI